MIEIIELLKNNYKNLEKYKTYIEKFTTNSYDFNNYLWQNKEYNNLEIYSFISEFDNILRLYKTPIDLTVYHKSPHDPREMLRLDNLIYYPPYISCSLLRKYVEYFFRDRNKKRIKNYYHNHIFKINIKKGNFGLFIPDEFNIDYKVKEFVIPRSSFLKYYKTETQETHQNNFTHIHEMELI